MNQTALSSGCYSTNYGKCTDTFTRLWKCTQYYYVGRGDVAHWLSRYLSTGRFESRYSRHVGTLGKSLTCSCPLRFGTVSVLCRERFWVVVDLKRRYRNGLNEWMIWNVVGWGSYRVGIRRRQGSLRGRASGDRKGSTRRAGRTADWQLAGSLFRWAHRMHRASERHSTLDPSSTVKASSGRHRPEPHDEFRSGSWSK